MAIGSSEFNSYGPFGGGGIGSGGWGGGWGGGFGGGIGGFGLFGLIGLLGRRGLGGDDCDGGGHGRDCAESIFNASVMSKLGTLEAAVPISTAAINANTVASAQGVKDNLVSLAAATNQAFQTQLLATLQGNVNLKDSIQLGIAASASQANETQNLINATTCAIKTAIAADGDQTRALINTIERENLLRQLEEERHRGRARETEINVTQTVNQNQNNLQQQQQQQQQFQFIQENFHRFGCRLGQIEAIQNQFSRQAQGGAVNFGSGTLTNTPTQANNQVGGQLV